VHILQSAAGDTITGVQTQLVLDYRYRVEQLAELRVAELELESLCENQILLFPVIDPTIFLIVS
jgi:hypothetical protein